MEIGFDSIATYWKTFGECGYNEPGDGFFVLAKSEDGEEKYYSAPENETDKTFMDRINRSLKAGKNLFAVEWEEELHDYDGKVE